MNKFNDLKLYRGATSVIELDFTGFNFGENSKCQLTIEKKYNNDVVYQHDFNKPIKYYITFKDEFTANLDDDKYKYDIMYMLNDERYPQCEISDICMEKVINNYNGEVNPDAVEVTEILTDGVEISDSIKINNSNVIITTDSKLQEISVIPTKEEQIILPEENYDGISKVIIEKISDEYIIPIGTVEITSNGIHKIAEFESANINVNPNLEEGRATPIKEEQIITPNEEYDGFSKVIVEPIPNEYIVPNGTLDIKINGTHDVTEKASVNVDVQPSLQDKQVTVKPNDNIYVMPDEDYYGLGVVNVVGAVDTENVEITPTKEEQTINRSEDKYIESVKVKPIPDEYIVPSGELEITENGNYDVTDKVSVKVETSGADLTEYFNTNPETIVSNQSYPFVATKYLLQFPDITLPDAENNCFAFYRDWKYLKCPAINNPEKIYSAECMFQGCYATEKYDFSKWNIDTISNANYMFSQCHFDEIDITNFKPTTNKANNMQNFFYMCYSKKIIAPNLMNNLMTSAIKFEGCSKLEELDISNWQTDKVTSMQGMFKNCSKLVSLDVSNFNTSNVTSMHSMFSGCYTLTSLDISNFITSKVESMYCMFDSCSKLTSLDLSNFDTSNVTNMSYMFSGCSASTSLDLSNFITSNVTNMSYMFSGCSALTSLDLSNFITSNVTNMNALFSGCKNLTYLDIRNFSFENVTVSYSNMFGSTSKVPADCLIIVKDDTAKEWITEKFTYLTNVKTVAEYEAQ